MHVQTAELSPARKAWVTRRAKLASCAAKPAIARAPEPARAVIVNRSTDAELRVNYIAPPELAPVADCRLVDLWLDDPVVGCGHRVFIVLDMSSREVRLFSPSPIATITIPRQVYDDRQRPARKVSRSRVANIIRRNVSTADRINDRAGKDVADDGGAFAPRALQLLGGLS